MFQLSTWIKRTLIIAMALVFSQFPAFENSYTERLLGHVDELRYEMGVIQEIAKQSGKTVDEFIAKFTSNPDADFQRIGEWMKGLQTRLAALENALYNLENASPITRPFVFGLHSDKSIVKATLQKFRVSVPLSLEGVIWCVLGAFVGYLIFFVFERLFRRIP